MGAPDFGRLRRALSSRKPLGFESPWVLQKANSTLCSQAVSHPSTNRAQCCLTSVIGRELVHSA